MLDSRCAFALNAVVLLRLLVAIVCAYCLFVLCSRAMRVLVVFMTISSLDYAQNVISDNHTFKSGQLALCSERRSWLGS